MRACLWVASLHDLCYRVALWPKKIDKTDTWICTFACSRTQGASLPEELSWRIVLGPNPTCYTLVQEARQKLREAQAQIATCKKSFHAAKRAGDHQKQQMYTSQIEHWQQVAAEEKQRAPKTIFSSK